jgi:hypothetical protein
VPIFANRIRVNSCHGILSVSIRVHPWLNPVMLETIIFRRELIKATSLLLWRFCMIGAGLGVLLLCSCGDTSTRSEVPAEASFDNGSGWWPTQAMPKALVRTKNQSEFPAPRASCEMMVQSVAGLAAKAVNEGRSDEMVWVGIEDNVDVEDWFARRLQRQPQLEMRGTFGPWELVDRYAKQGLIKGYILYRADSSRGETSQHRPGMDCSVNVATSLAGLLDGIIVDESLEAEARAHGLALLLDVRHKTQAWCFATYQDRFNRRMVCTQDPRKPSGG